MLEPRSALAAFCRPGRLGSGRDGPPVVVHERSNRSLLQLSGWPDTFDSVLAALEARLGFAMPADFLHAAGHRGQTVFRVGPERLWLAGWAGDASLPGVDGAGFGGEAVLTELGQSRTVLRIAGSASQALLNRGLPIDLDDSVFTADSFAQSAIHHVPVLVHRIDVVGIPTFDVYLPREYSQTFWEWLAELIEAFGGEIEQSR